MLQVDETSKQPETKTLTETKYRVHYIEQHTGKKGTDGLFPEKWKDDAFGYASHMNRVYRSVRKYYIVAVQIPVTDVKTG